MKSRKRDPFYGRIREILDSAQATAARSVNSAQVVSHWLIGHEIVEEEQRGRARAAYGAGLLVELSRRLTADYGRGFSLSLLKDIKAFYIGYPQLVTIQPLDQKGHAARGLLPGPEKGHAARGLSSARSRGKGSAAPVLVETSRALDRKSWRPGYLHLNLSWTHYRMLLRVEKLEARAFYEIETIKNNWSARELERQISSLLYERLAFSKDKKGLLRLAKKGHEVQSPLDVFKDPVVLEFLKIPHSRRLVETDLEAAMLENLQAFLLELGKGFAFVARQERLTLEGDHFYIDLVFYHTVLKCFVIIDLKVGKLTHQDIGQLQLYVNYYDRERRTPGDNPTLGLILCTDKNDSVVKYTLGDSEKKNNIFTSRYRLMVPTEAELKAELRRELRRLGAHR